MSAKSKMHVCLVCHTEPDVWDGGFLSIDTVLPRFEEMMASVQDHAGTTPRVAWCLTGQVAQHRPGPFQRMVTLGHEIGVHSHYPGADGTAEHQQQFNREKLDAFSTWFPDLCDRIVAAGFAPPRTNATWMFAYHDSMTRVLTASGICVDCSTCYGGAHYLPDGLLLADSRERISGKPYRLSEENHCVEGSSSLVELPVSGGLGCYWEPNEKGEFQFFSPVASDAEMSRQLRLFQKRLEALSSGEIDIFHIHFHLYEFLPPDGTGEARLDRAKRLLASLVQDTRVCFSTPSVAAAHWLQNGIRRG